MDFFSDFTQDQGPVSHSYPYPWFTPTAGLFYLLFKFLVNPFQGFLGFVPITIRIVFGFNQFNSGNTIAIILNEFAGCLLDGCSGFAVSYPCL